MTLREVVLAIIADKGAFQKIRRGNDLMTIQQFYTDHLDDRWNGIDCGVDRETGAAVVRLGNDRQSGPIFTVVA